jgi:hypothetical protein
VEPLLRDKLLSEVYHVAGDLIAPFSR